VGYLAVRKMSKAIPWWWTETGYAKENDLFYGAWKTIEDCFSATEFTNRAFIAEQIVGEKWEAEQ
jgi:hypothetical protein